MSNPSSFTVLHERLSFETASKNTRMITSEIAKWLRMSGALSGTVTLLCMHTSASLMLMENADPTVQDDILAYLDDLAPEGRYYEHSYEGPDDMPAHLKTMLTSASLTIPVQDGTMVLGTWQGIFLMEHRAHRHRRQVHLTFTGLVAD